MEACVKVISMKLPCRDEVIYQLYGFIGYADECFPESIFLLGHTGTGKTSIVKAMLQHCKYKSAYINCVECYSSKILCESVLNLLSNHTLTAQTNYAPYMKCDTMDDFLLGLKRIAEENGSNHSYVIVLDKAERLRDMEHNILPCFLRLRELTKGLNICSVLISDIAFEKFYNKTGLAEPITIVVPQYNKSELLRILLLDFRFNKNMLYKSFSPNNSEHLKNASDVIESLEEDFYKNYLNLCLNVFFRACRDLPELRHLCGSCFVRYCQPVITGAIGKDDVNRLWRNVSPVLKAALGTVYVRVKDIANELPPSDKFDSFQIQKISKTDADDLGGCAQSLAQNIELPFYAKYLLIAAYLASYNPAKEDKRLFMKHHGKQRKRVQTIKARAKVTEKLNTQSGPKIFTLDRLLAIFYAILEDRVGLTCNLLAQVSSLVQLQLLVGVGGAGDGGVLDSARYQCAVGLDFTQTVAKTVGFNVRKYLYDFM